MKKYIDDQDSKIKELQSELNEIRNKYYVAVAHLKVIGSDKFQLDNVIDYPYKARKALREIGEL